MIATNNQKWLSIEGLNYVGGCDKPVIRSKGKKVSEKIIEKSLTESWLRDKIS